MGPWCLHPLPMTPSFSYVYVFFKVIVLIYNSCTEGYIVIFTYVLTIYLCKIYASIVLPLPPLVEQFNKFWSFIFIYGYKIYPPYSPSFSLSLCPSLPHWYLPLEKTYFSLLPFNFFQVSIDSPRGFRCGTSGLYLMSMLM
jgi:hypothetical protein